MIPLACAIISLARGIIPLTQGTTSLARGMILFVSGIVSFNDETMDKDPNQELKTSVQPVQTGWRKLLFLPLIRIT